MNSLNIYILPSGMLDTANAAKYLGISVKTLANYRVKGTGPQFTKRGRILYSKTSLDSWLNEKQYTSTAQARLKKGGEE